MPFKDPSQNLFGFIEQFKITSSNYNIFHIEDKYRFIRLVIYTLFDNVFMKPTDYHMVNKISSIIDETILMTTL